MRQDIPPAIRQDPPPARQDSPIVAAAVPAAAADEPARAAAEPAVPAFSDVAALVQSLPAEEDAAAAAANAPARTASSSPATRQTATPPAANRTTAPAARTGAPGASRTTAANARPAARDPPPPPNPSRHWVQLAGGDRDAFNFQLGRLRQSAPELLRNRTAYWARNGSSNRLLVGPFASAAEAQAFVNQLARRDVASFAWRSEAGEEVERLPAR
jgi:hypothetical protein